MVRDIRNENGRGQHDKWNHGAKERDEREIRDSLEGGGVRSRSDKRETAIVAVRERVEYEG